MTTATLIAGLLVGGFFGWLWIGERMYKRGAAYGRERQMREDLAMINHVLIAKARADQLAEVWEKRARALLFAGFGSDRKS